MKFLYYFRNPLGDYGPVEIGHLATRYFESADVARKAWLDFSIRRRVWHVCAALSAVVTAASSGSPLHDMPPSASLLVALALSLGAATLLGVVVLGFANDLKKVGKLSDVPWLDFLVALKKLQSMDPAVAAEVAAGTYDEAARLPAIAQRRQNSWLAQQEAERFLLVRPTERRHWGSTRSFHLQVQQTIRDSMAAFKLGDPHQKFDGTT